MTDTPTPAPHQNTQLDNKSVTRPRSPSPVPQLTQQEQQQHQQQPHDNLPEPVKTLKEAFPDVDVEVIEAILESQNGQMERSFEVLLGMSDPDYKSQEHAAPVNPPPAPLGSAGEQTAYAYTREPRSQEELIRMDEEYAKQLALEDERERVRHQQRLRQAQSSESGFNFQEELPIIKERVIEAGNAAKKKVMDLYNQFKASRQANDAPREASIPATNAKYHGLPSDDGDDLLTGDMSALHLSENDVYAKTATAVTGSPRRSGEYYGRDTKTNATHVNPLREQNRSTSAAVQDQIRADEELARRLAQEDQLWETRANHPPTMPPRTPTPAKQHQDDLDGEPVVLTAPDTPSYKHGSSQDVNIKSYIIGNDDDSDLVDIDQDAASESGKGVKQH